MTWRSAAASSSLHAAQRADELMAAGDMDGRGVWTGSIAPYATRSPINTDNSGSAKRLRLASVGGRDGARPFPVEPPVADSFCVLG